MGKKRMFGICNAMCSSSASVGENLCGVLELAKGVGTIEKLWCIWLCSSREAPSLPTILAFPHDTLGCRWIKRVEGRRHVAEPFPSWKTLSANYIFRPFCFSTFCSVVIQKQFEVPIPAIFSSWLPHIKNGNLNMWDISVFLMVCNG